MTIEETERAKYKRVWQEDTYRQVCHSKVLWDEHRDCFPVDFGSALDIGCGLGLMISQWRADGKIAYGIDIADNCLDDRNNSVFVSFRPLWVMKDWALPFDVGVCADVMEHIPRDKVVRSLRRIAACCKHVVFKIDHASNSFIGETLHLTIEPVEWWIAQMNSIAGNAELIRTAARGGGIKGSVVIWKTGA
jgi:2-polyprenyl-3-methyl-5-hydroxy-6-metoxy-1,4-benzoquinol methylase